ncbi:hypothetical protein PILCRDRAFT_827638 [Piloderma croceum F 1598]|uniref:Uncharacterized protein n=1 Tax=Piloderma croceum (strain F 1598) TaxID=765440 RepID=A0A0C3ER68_PILCF|nr:hypothetical protein PILCRDRAFT_827638 [Piloderma croceum F 1598]
MRNTERNFYSGIDQLLQRRWTLRGFKGNVAWSNRCPRKKWSAPKRSDILDGIG